MAEQDHVTRFIRILKKIHQSIIPLKDSSPSFKDAEFHLGRAIESLQNYTGKQGQFVPKPPPGTPSSIRSSKKKNTP